MPRPKVSRALVTLGVLAISATGAAFTGCGDDAQNQVNDALDNAQEQINQAAQDAQNQAEDLQNDIQNQIDDATGDDATSTTTTESAPSSDY